MDADSNRFYSWVPEEPENVKIVSWDTLFNKCNEFRKHNRIPDDEHVILLTYLVNDLNWFSGSDENGYNHFIHADQWDFFLPCDPKFPVAYEVMACVIRRFMFRNYHEGSHYFHQKPRGCLNDFCKEKKEVTLKLRTGDICPDCMKLIRTKSVPVNVIDQVMKTFDSIRAQMLFRERYRAVQLPSRLTIEGPMHKIYFTDLANAELKLTPLEKTVYLLFLKEKDGLKLNELCDHRDWIKDTYIRIGNANNLAGVFVAGKRAPLLGRVSMDQFVVDLGESSDAKTGDQVIVFGPGLQGEYTADDWGRASGTINYEIVTRIAARVPRLYNRGAALH